MFINFLNKNNNFNYNTPYNIKSDYFNFFHMYSVFISLGIFVSVFFSFLMLKKKKIPLDFFSINVFIIIIASLFGASFFGKYNWDINNPWRNDNGILFFSLFYFWKPGMSIHGGVIFGIIFGIAVFIHSSRKYKISILLYVDCIIPNILLGQSIGRWGNFFNHELLGNVVSYESLKWLPSFIRDNCWQWFVYDYLPETDMNGFIIYRSPIFLYESFLNFFLWLFIIFFIPNIGKFFGSKPWKKNFKKYPFDIKNNFKSFFSKKKYNNKKYLTWNQIWQKVEYNNNIFCNKKNLDIMYYNLNSRPKPIGFKQKIKYWWFGESYQLTKLNNFENYPIIRVGVQGGFYIFGWNFIRFFLEFLRTNDDELFIMNNRILDYFVLLFFVFLGLLFISFCQFFAPFKLRRNGYVYEKEYIDYNNLSNWKLKDYFLKNFYIGLENKPLFLENSIKKNIMKYLGFYSKDFDKYFILNNLNFNSNNNEIFSFSFDLESKKSKLYNNEFYGSLNLKIFFSFDLWKFFNKKTIYLSKKNKKLLFFSDKKYIIELIINFLNNNFKKNIRNKLKLKFNNIYFKNSNILKLDFNNFLNFKNFKFNKIFKKKFYLLKPDFNFNNFYFFSKKVLLKIKWN